MSYRIVPTPNFQKEAKRLKKKYPSLKNELEILGETLLLTPTTGVHLGNNIYKIRLAIKSKGKGKRGGARVMTKIKIVNNVIYLFSIYSKGDKDTITDEEIKELIKEIP